MRFEIAYSSGWKISNVIILIFFLVGTICFMVGIFDPYFILHEYGPARNAFNMDGINGVRAHAFGVCVLGIPVSAMWFFRLIRHRVWVKEDYLLVEFGLEAFSKKIPYENIKRVRYKTKEDKFVRGNPNYGELSQTVVLELQNMKEDIYYISVSNREGFCKLVQEKIDQASQNSDIEIMM